MDDFTTLAGPLWSRLEAGAKRYAFLAEQKHLNRYGGVHGGMLLWLADKALRLKAWEARFARMAQRTFHFEEACRTKLRAPLLTTAQALRWAIQQQGLQSWGL